MKLWVNEWLTGTVRWQLTPQQRSIWADLLALAGRSRFPGIVCSGETNGELSPFPMDYLCSVFRCSEADVSEAFRLFVEQGRIVINKIGVIQIVNWEKYQSEYQQKRQRTEYRNSPKSLSNVRTKSSVEVEGEVEVEEEKRDKTRAATQRIAPDSGASAIDLLGRNELKGLQTTLKRSLRSSRCNGALRAQLEKQLREVEEKLK